MRYTEIFEMQKMLKTLIVGTRYNRLADSNEYPQSMFLMKNDKNRYTPVYPSFLHYSGV